MSPRLNSCALALAATVLSSSVAHAATPGALPTACGSREAFDAELRARLGQGARTSDVLVTIAPRGDGFHLRVTMGAEQRELEDPSCTELFRAAIVIAVSMLMESAKREAPEVAPAPAPEVAPAPAPEARPRSRPRLTVGLGAGLVAGTLPQPVLALELEGKALWRDLGVGANVRYLLPAEKRDETQQGADLSALGAGVTGIFRPSLDWEARLGFAAQHLRGSGVGRNSGYSATVWAAGPTLGLGWVPLRSSSFWAGLGAEGQLNAVRGRFEIINHSGELTGERTTIYRVPWLAAGAFLRFGAVW